jgi:hypothetical protein
MPADLPNIPQMDWGQLKIWQIWDPIPWWVLDREKLERILVAQIDFKIATMQREVEQMQKIRQIVAGKAK